AGALRLVPAPAAGAARRDENGTRRTGRPVPFFLGPRRAEACPCLARRRPCTPAPPLRPAGARLAPPRPAVIRGRQTAGRTAPPASRTATALRPTGPTAPWSARS